MENKKIYVVVKYPKKINPWEINGHLFHVYTKSTSNLEVMRAYFKEIKEKHSDNYYVHLVTREKAKEMKNTWREKYCVNEKPTLTLEELDNRINNIYEKHAFYL
jgi:hypothetical protein